MQRLIDALADFMCHLQRPQSRFSVDNGMSTGPDAVDEILQFCIQWGSGRYLNRFADDRRKTAGFRTRSGTSHVDLLVLKIKSEIAGFRENTNSAEFF